MQSNQGYRSRPILTCPAPTPTPTQIDLQDKDNLQRLSVADYWGQLKSGISEDSIPRPFRLEAIVKAWKPVRIRLQIWTWGKGSDPNLSCLINLSCYILVYKIPINVMIGRRSKYYESSHREIACGGSVPTIRNMSTNIKLVFNNLISLLTHLSHKNNFKFNYDFLLFRFKL